MSEVMLLLKRHRIATGRTISEVSKHLGVAESTVCRWETGVSAPRPRTLKKLARMLGMNPFDLSKMIEPDMPLATTGSK